MRLQEEFKLFESMWDEGVAPKTSTLEVHIGARKGNKIVDKKGVSHMEAYKELVKTLKGLSDEDMYELDIWWMADKEIPGDKKGDAILYVDGATVSVEDVGEDPNDFNGNGYKGGIANPANRLILTYAYEAEDLGLPSYAYDFIVGLLDVDVKAGA